MIIKHKQQCYQKEKTSDKTSAESHIYWEKQFHKNPLYFRINADFDADNEIKNSSIVNKTTNIYKQNPVCKRYIKESELEDVSKKGYYKSPSGYENVDCFVDEVIKVAEN